MAEHFEILDHLQIISPALAQRLKKAVGFRNIAVHSYQAIDWSIVFQISRHHLYDFKQFPQAVTKRLSAS